MSENYTTEAEREYPNSHYDKDAYDRLYGNSNVVASNDNASYSQQSTINIYEKAKYLIDNEYVDPTIDIKVIIARLEEIDKGKGINNEDQ